MQSSQELNNGKFFRRLSWRGRIVAAVIPLGVAVFFAVFWVAGRYKLTLWPYPCGFKQRYELPCPGCGMTTASMAFAQGRILEAFYIQPATALILCGIVATAVFGVFVAVTGRYFVFLERFLADVKVKYVILALAIIFACGWAVTLARALAAKNQ
jgi:hypothetical protein